MTVSAEGPHSRSRDLALIAIFAGFIAALAIVPAFQPPGFSVPITAQTLGVMLAGAILGARRGALAVLTLLVLVAIGLPLLASGRAGLGPFFTPSGGFLVGWPVAAFVTGWLTERGGATYRLPWGVVANVVGGIVVLYVFGIAGIAWIGHIPLTEAVVSTWIFIPGDLVKAVLAAVIAKGVHAAYPGLLGDTRRKEKADSAV